MIRLLTGENEFALLQEQKKLIDEFLKQYDSFGLDRLDADELDTARIRSALLQLPFLVSKKLVVIKNVFSSKHIQEILLDLFGDIPDEIDVLLIDSKSDKRTKLYKELQAKYSITDFTELKGALLERWMVNYASQCGGRLTSENARYLVDRIGPNQMQIARELEKLAVFGEITSQLIDIHTEQALRGTIFDLLDMTFSGKAEQALKTYDELLANKTDPAEILSLIGWQLHVFALIKYAGNGAPAEVSKQIGVHPFVVGKSMNTVRGLSIDNIKLAVVKALDADSMIKTKPVDSIDVVRVLLLELTDI